MQCRFSDKKALSNNLRKGSHGLYFDSPMSNALVPWNGFMEWLYKRMEWLCIKEFNPGAMRVNHLWMDVAP